MRIAKSMLNIAFGFVGVVLAFSFIRITMSGGDISYRISVGYVLDILSSVSLDSSGLVQAVDHLLGGWYDAWSAMKFWKNGSWTGSTALDRIVSIFIAYFEGFSKFLTWLKDSVYSLSAICVWASEVLSTITGVIKKLLLIG